MDGFLVGLKYRLLSLINNKNVTIYDLKCNKCSVSFGKLMGSGELMYVNLDGEKKPIGLNFLVSGKLKSFLEKNGLEYHEIADYQFGKQSSKELFKKEFDKLSSEKKAVLEKVVGVASELVCIDCLTEFLIDRDKEEKFTCDKCGSKKLYQKAYLAGLQCPRCKEGFVQKLVSAIV